MMSAAEVTSRMLRAAEEAPRNKQRMCLGVRLSDSVAHMYWTRASCDRRRLYDSEIKFLSKAYTNPIVLYLYIYIALLAVHTNQKRFQCERPREKRAVLREQKEALGSPVNKVDRVEGRSWFQ